MSSTALNIKVEWWTWDIKQYPNNPNLLFENKKPELRRSGGKRCRIHAQRAGVKEKVWNRIEGSGLETMSGQKYLLRTKYGVNCALLSGVSAGWGCSGVRTVCLGGGRGNGEGDDVLRRQRARTITKSKMKSIYAALGGHRMTWRRRSTARVTICQNATVRGSNMNVWTPEFSSSQRGVLWSDYHHSPK